MLTKPSRKKSPQQRQEEALKHERRYCYEYRNGAVRTWAKKKKRDQRAVRRKVSEFSLNVARHYADDLVDSYQDDLRPLTGYRVLYKGGVLSLGELLEAKRRLGRRPVY